MPVTINERDIIKHRGAETGVISVRQKNKIIHYIGVNSKFSNECIQEVQVNKHKVYFLRKENKHWDIWQFSLKLKMRSGTNKD